MWEPVLQKKDKKVIDYKGELQYKVTLLTPEKVRQ